MNETKTIDVKKIMQEIELEIQKKMVNDEYAKDIHKLQRMGEMNFVADKDFTDLYALTFLSKRTTIPRSTKSGIFSKILNSLIIKIYYVVVKIMTPVLQTQERLNKSLVEELAKIKEQIGISKAEGFPYEEFDKEYIERYSLTITQANELDKFISHKKTLGIFGKGVIKLFDFALNTDVQHVVCVDPSIPTHKTAAEKRFVLKNEEYFEVLKGRTNYEFDSMIFVDIFEYFPLEHVFGILKEINRVMATNGDLIIRLSDPSNMNVHLSHRDPQIAKYIHKELLIDMLKFNKFGNIQEITNLDLNEKGYKYVITAKKK